MTTELKVGDKAPDFQAVAVGGEYGAGKEVTLADFKGRTLVLYFYPKDQTPGCTTQACALRDGWEDVPDRAAVFGVSADSAASHTKFIENNGLPFPLLSDPGKHLISAYGFWVEKSMYGKKYMGIERSTVVIGPDQRIHAILRKVKPGEHLAKLLAVLAEPAQS